MDARDAGYDEAAEDRLLADLDWEHDGYRLFSAATLAASSARGWFRPMGESNGLFMPAALWQELGGLDEGFALPGGGLSNHDLFRRACELDDVQLVVLLGEGTFHQIHGGAATSGRIGWDEMHAEYVARRGHAYQPPPNERLYVGTVPDAALAARRALRGRARQLGELTDRDQRVRLRKPLGLKVRPYFSIVVSATNSPCWARMRFTASSGPGPEARPHRVAVDDRVLHDHVGADRHERRVDLELALDPQVGAGQRAEHDERAAVRRRRSRAPGRTCRRPGPGPRCR